MAESLRTLYEEIAVLANQIASLARAAASLAGQPSQQSVLADLRQQQIALNDLFSSLIIANDSITVGDISDSNGVAIGAGAQSTSRTTTTAGGDYAEGNIDKRSGVFVSDSAVTGSVVGINNGTIEAG